MTAATKSKINHLQSIILANYTAAKNYNPAFATQCAMEMILKLALSQPKPEWCDQILDEEITDNLKAKA
jgi:hypothetical protein